MKKKKLLQLLKVSPAVRKAKGKYDKEWFARYYFRKHLFFPCSDFQREWIDLFENYKRVAIACPRGHTKSTWWSFILVIHAVLYQTTDFIVILSDTSEQAKNFIGAIVEELETNESIIKDFGKVAGYVSPIAEEKQKWTASDIVTSTGIRVAGYGFTQKLRGIKHRNKRPGLIILDDVENDQSVLSSEQRQKYKNIFQRSILNIGDEFTKIYVVGTILHNDSLLNFLLNNDSGVWEQRMYKAIQNNEPLWKERYTLENMEEKRKEIGSIAFEQEYMNNPLADGQRIFTISKYYENIDLGFYNKFAYLDLAAKEKEQSDYCAIVTVARHRENGDIKIIDPRRMKGSVDKILDWFIEYFLLYKHNMVGIEGNNFQTWFSQLLKTRTEPKGIYIPFREITQTKDKVLRAKPFSVYVENGTVEFNKNHQDFNAEIENFPKGSHDDYVDSLVGGLELALGTAGDGNVFSGSNNLAENNKNVYSILKNQKSRYPQNL